MDEQSVKGTEFLNKIKDRIYEAVFPDCNEVRVEGRIKSVHGIYRKMYMQNKSFEQIYDIYAVRIIVQTLRECWNALGCVHDLFTPVNERFKDYTSNPKANGYQSIHTTVVGSDGIKFEVQIRTEEMHRTAEYGIAAHWKYKSGQRSGKFSKNSMIRQDRRRIFFRIPMTEMKFCPQSTVILPPKKFMPLHRKVRRLVCRKAQP